MNLLTLAGIDLCRRNGRKMLSREAASHALSATLAIAVTAVAGVAILTAGKLPAVTLLGVGGWSWALLIACLLGARMLFIDQRISARLAADGVPERSGTVGRPAAAFLAAAAVLLMAGPQLAAVSADLAERSGLCGTFVGTALVAVTTSLPELVATMRSGGCRSSSRMPCS